ncbi:MAG: type III-A CRISPR-associated RAMP protein Csm4 [Coriobacteriales bacterium]|jgi:CRISPR-associated protein Csm4|nr:type III-A CRISPR-associated RAMP protein Csm4 [Coriobacteriales bacterium]
MNTQIVKLKFTSPVHFGEGRLTSGAPTCAADTLFSALFIEALAQGRSEELLACAKAGELLISDAFPWIDISHGNNPQLRHCGLERHSELDSESQAAERHSELDSESQAAERHSELDSESQAASLEIAGQARNDKAASLEIAGQARNDKAAHNDKSDVTYYLPKPYIAVEKSARNQEDAPAMQIANASTNENADGSASTNSNNSEQAQSQIKKAMKKLKYIPASMLSSYLTSNIDPFQENENFKLGTPSLTTKVNLTYVNGEDDVQGASSQSDAKPYHVGGFTYEDNAGLYFIVQTSAQNPFDLQSILEPLQYSGLGGKRSSGYGRFEYEIVSSAEISELLNIKDKKDMNGTKDMGGSVKILLSSAAPTNKELTEELLQGASYQLLRRSGFVQSDTYALTQQKKRDLYTFAAGSVFCQTFSGDVFDVSMTVGGNPPGHPVYRYAKAMWLEVQG